MKKFYLLMFTFLFVGVSIFSSCKHKDPDDEPTLNENGGGNGSGNDEENTEDEIVSPDYVSIDWENASIISSNDSIGDYQINFTGEVPNIVPGSVIAIDNENILRYVFVESVNVEGNTLNIKTSQAYLTDILANTNITLTTDNNRRGHNVFLPTEIFYYDDKGDRCEVDLKMARNDNFGFTHDIWKFSDNLNGTLLLSDENCKIYVEKLSYNVDIDLVMEMNFGGRDEMEIMANGLERYKSRALNIETSLVGNFDTEQMLRFDTEGDCSCLPEYEMLKADFFRPVTVRFLVHEVPVEVTLGSDLFGQVELSAEGNMSAHLGFVDRANGLFGFNWAQSGGMTSNYSFSNTFDLMNPTIEGKGSIEAKACVFPSVKLMIYDAIGPSFDFKPYLSTTLRGGFNETTLGTDNDYCSWNFDFSSGVDAANELSLRFIGYETEYYSTDNENIVDKLLYHSPEKIEFIPMRDRIRVGEGKEVKFNVYDINYLLGTEVLTSLSQIVKFEGDGYFSEEYGIADKGEASVVWTPSSENDVMYARLYDYEGNVVTEAEFTIETKVTTSSVTNITTEGATCGGDVSCYYDDDIYERGICWSETSEPDVNDYYATSGSGAGSFTCDMTGLKDNTTYYVKAYAKMYDYVVYGEQKSFKTEEKENDELCAPDGEIVGYSYVDLGLPSGLKWATCNVGAALPEEYGGYYAWGETSTKSAYYDSNCETYGKDISDISGNVQYDAATANWGGSWRIPTKNEMEELVDHCEWEWIQLNGVNGAKIIGPNGKCIFLPAAGYRYGVYPYSDGNGGKYWTSTPYDGNSGNASYSLDTSDGFEDVWNNTIRYYGMSVRPVSE